MKRIKISKYLLGFSPFIALMLISLFPNKERTVNTNSLSFTDGAITVNLNYAQDGLVSFPSSQEENNLLELVNQNTTLLTNIQEIEKSYVRNQNGYTVVVYGINPDGGGNLMIGFELSGGSAGGQAIDIDKTHTCTGNPCSCCDFTYNNNGKIDGCDCDDGINNPNCKWGMGEKKCTHSVTAKD
jgi:hypothetical protein